MEKAEVAQGSQNLEQPLFFSFILLGQLENGTEEHGKNHTPISQNHRFFQIINGDTIHSKRIKTR